MTGPDFRAEAEAMSAQLTAWRREFHRHPELAFHETYTAARAADVLRKLGLSLQTGLGKTGVLGTLVGGHAGPTVMLRADMDALPIHETSDVPYASETPGAMHACGHDGHVAMALGAATMLAGHAASLPGQVLFLFQPAEESDGGARAVIADGALDNPRPDAVFGLHLWNSVPVGRICAQAGPLMAAADLLRIVVRGHGGHGALPHETVDAIAVTGQVLSALQTIVSRNVDPQETAVLSIGTVRGGTAYNVISDTVELQGTIRTFSPAVRETVVTRLRVLLDGITAGMGARYDLIVQPLAPAVINDVVLSDVARAAALQVAGPHALTRLAPTMTSEDFAEYQRQVAGCFILIGSQNADLGLSEPHHNPRFDFDERALPIGAALLAASASRFLHQKAVGAQLRS